MNHKRYFYRVSQSTPLGKELRRLHRKCEHAEAAAEKFAAKVGAKMYYPHPTAFVGGVACVSFDTKPDQDLWQCVGKDADGIEMWEPKCQTRKGREPYDGKKRPADTATRIYNRNQSADGYLYYTELYRNDKSKSSKRGKDCNLTAKARKAICTERQRRLLPVVYTASFFKLLGAELLEGVDQRTRSGLVKITPVTPTFFICDNYYYVCAAYPCHAEGLTEISRETFMLKKQDMLQVQRNLESLQNEPDFKAS